jgi:hypothetical protein
LRVYVCGPYSGDAKKAEIVAAARERWGVEITDDEAEARFVAEAVGVNWADDHRAGESRID